MINKVNTKYWKRTHKYGIKLPHSVEEALKIDRKDVRAYAEKYTWPECAAEFIRNLEPYPEPAKTKLWTKLRQLPRRMRRKKKDAA